MDLNTFSQVIGNLGFPIFVSVYMLYYNNKSLDETKNTVSENTLVLSKLSNVIDKLIDKLDKKEDMTHE